MIDQLAEGNRVTSLQSLAMSSFTDIGRVRRRSKHIVDRFSEHQTLGYVRPDVQNRALLQ